jgi:hypothetical protein
MADIGKAEIFHLYKIKLVNKIRINPLKDEKKREREKIRTASCSAYSSILKMEEIYSSATSVKVSRLHFIVIAVRISNVTAQCGILSASFCNI